MLLFLLAVLFFFTLAADPCAHAPTEAAKILCRQIHRWDDKARTSASQKKIALPPGHAGLVGKTVAADFAPIATTIYQCMDLSCMCTYLRGASGPGGVCTLSNGFPLTKAVRKEYRMMTDDERQRFHNAIKTMKQNGEFDRLARIHAQATSGGGAHSGPAFLPWHREYIKRVEIAIRQIDPFIHLPYWDSTLDQALPSPKDSVMFTADLMGGTDSAGNVINGPFYPWRTLEGRGNILRRVGAQGSLLDQSNINYVMGKTRIDEVLAFTAPRQGCPYRTDFNCLEYTHGNVHIFIGGDMFDTNTAANDPIFYLHHSFVDMIWEMWRQRSQSRAQRETAFPPDNQLCSAPQHFSAATLSPFPPIRNHDGISNMYTDNLYSYAPRPTCSNTYRDCGSRFLFCDLSHGNPRCVSKMRVGAACGMYRAGENPCYNGVCNGGICIFTTATPIPTPRHVTPAPVVTIQESCFNENQCCASWVAAGECTRNPGYMREWCMASCSICRPTYRLQDDCSDRHSNCYNWSRSGECLKNPLWMVENCRRSCGKCGRSRGQECAAGIQHAQSQPQCDNSEGCYNENVCCPHWSLMGECRSNATWMACNCRVSCGHCNPTDYAYGSCTDYHHSCTAWAQRGECQKNPWMTENCRQSCQTCYSQFDLRSMCSGRAGSVAPLATKPNGNWNQGGMTEGGWAPEAPLPMMMMPEGPRGWRDGPRRWRFGDYDDGPLFGK